MAGGAGPARAIAAVGWGDASAAARGGERAGKRRGALCVHLQSAGRVHGGVHDAACRARGPAGELLDGHAAAGVDGAASGAADGDEAHAPRLRAGVEAAQVGRRLRAQPRALRGEGGRAQRHVRCAPAQRGGALHDWSGRGRGGARGPPPRDAAPGGGGVLLRAPVPLARLLRRPQTRRRRRHGDGGDGRVARGGGEQQPREQRARELERTSTA
mmetsp:Transcript_5637/g.19301  ORF Transcript_5637/g.19301 Transcript_5637/m.19301 type:complete len:214 (-) Transcript_5637:41-682(-)